VALEKVVADTGNERQVVLVEEPLILDVKAVQSIAELGCCIRGIVRASPAAVVDVVRTAELELINSGKAAIRIIEPLLRRQRGTERRVAAGIVEIVPFAANGVLHERIEYREFLTLVSDSNEMVASQVLASELDEVGFGVERIGLAGGVSPQEDLVVRDVDAVVPHVPRAGRDLGR